METADDHRHAGGPQRRAQSITRGNWFDCTPTKPTMPKPPLSWIGGRCGRPNAGVGLVNGKISIATSSPRT